MREPLERNETFEINAVMEYKGYIATIEYDDSVGLLHGSVVNSGDYPIANCEAADEDTLREEFRVSIDEYLAMCAEDGLEPRRPSWGMFSLHMGEELHRRVAITAARSRKSIDDWINDVLEREAEAL